jgi:hypothetical protein
MRLCLIYANLTGSVNLSHSEYRTFKVLRSDKITSHLAKNPHRVVVRSLVFNLKVKIWYVNLNLKVLLPLVSVSLKVRYQFCFVLKSGDENQEKTYSR